MNSKRPLYALLSLMLLILGSCVSPGDFDQTVVARYQEAMAAKAPQPRQSNTGLGSLLPRPPTGPKLNVVRQPSGKCTVNLSLDEAIMRALANNLDIKVVSFDPQISREQVIQAAAAFDYIVFGSVSWQKQDTPPARRFGTVLRSTYQNQETSQYQAGIRQTNILGGTMALAPTWTYISDNTGSVDDRVQTGLQFQINQPLLRNAGPTFALSQMRIAQINYKNSMAQFRQKVEETLNTVIDSYWQLVQARQFLVIQQRLLDVTIETRERTRQRLKIDATMVELKQAEAAVETRRATLIRAIKNIGDAQDQLTRLLADAQLNVLSNYEIVPTTPAAQILVKIDPADQIMLSLVHNPVLEQARLGIAASQINVQVAENQTLPKLDLQGSISPLGQGSHLGSSINNFFNHGFVSYSVALVFEYPIGNRAALAELSRRKFEWLQSITTLQNTVDQLAVQINERIRQINTTFDEMQAQRAAVSASAAQLQALNDIEQIRGRLTPEFLQLKLQAQESLANAYSAELQALISYNQALSDLSRFTGTILMQHGIDVLKMPAVTGQMPWPQSAGPVEKLQATTTPIRPVGSTAPAK